jgi:Protein of unknown function (DUF3159)
MTTWAPPTAPSQPAFEVEIPHVLTVARHAIPRVVEGTLVPLVLFVIGLRVIGVWGAMLAGLGWTYAAIAVRLVTRRPVPGILAIGAITLTVRTIIAGLSHSAVVYFLQPSLGTIAVSAAFLLSVPFGRPLAGKLAADFCPLSREVHGNQHVRDFFRRISLLWAAAQAANAALTLWLLFSQSLSTFVVFRSVVSAGTTITAIAISTLWFRWCMRRHGITVRMAPRVRAATAV